MANSVILTSLARSGPEFDKQFIDNLKEIYLNSKEDILKVLKTSENDRLPLLRIKLYIRIIENYPELELYELSTMHCLAEDIYEFG